MTQLVSVTREDGATNLLTLRAFFAQVDLDDLPAVSCALMGNRLIKVKLMNGDQVEARPAEEHVDPNEDQRSIPFDPPYKPKVAWPVQALRPKPTHEHHARVKLMFSLECTIHNIDAVDEEHATQVIKEIMRGDHRPNNGGVTITFDQDETTDFLQRLKRMLDNGDPSQMTFDEVLATEFFDPEPVRALSYSHVQESS